MRTEGPTAVVALTGIILVAYVIGHLLGNLQIFAGRAQINIYADFLHSHEMFLRRLFDQFLDASRIC